MLFDPDRHEAICDTAWDASRAHAALRSIAQDIAQARMSDGGWPAHPLDDDGEPPRAGYKSLYLGRAGLLWALWHLRREGAIADAGIDLAEAMRQTDAAYQADPDTGERVPSYLLGESGILLALWRITGAADIADRLHDVVRSNIANPTNEALWAAPGTMVAAWHLWEATGEERWRTLFLENVEQLWRTWAFDAQLNAHLWTQDLYGKVVQYLGAGHGFVGNVYPLLKGASLLDEARRAELFARCAQTLQATAHIEDGLVNWRPGMFEPRAGGARMLMQWCHGAPGVVTALTDFPRGLSPEMDALLVGAGHAVWAAGPLSKGYGLCHGTAGNGHAFLTLYQRTGEPLWLERARAFAMHAIAQQQRLQQQHGRGRYTLWTGDAGLAVYLWQCLQGTAGLPGWDILQ